MPRPEQGTAVIRLRPRHILLSLLLAALSACAPAPEADPAGAPAWLLGTWALAHDPDGDPQDWLVFAADGELRVRSHDGREFPGRWQLDGDTVRMAIQIDGRRLGIDLIAAPGRDRLGTQSGAWYDRTAATPP